MSLPKTNQIPSAHSSKVQLPQRSNTTSDFRTTIRAEVAKQVRNKLPEGRQKHQHLVENNAVDSPEEKCPVGCRTCALARRIKSPLPGKVNGTAQCFNVFLMTQSTDAHSYYHIIKIVSDEPFHVDQMVLLPQRGLDQQSALVLKAGRDVPFKFLHLPHELRHMIYKFIYPKENVSITMRPPNKKKTYAADFSRPCKLSLLSTCHLVRHEALPVVYHRKFVFKTANILLSFLIQCSSYCGLTDVRSLITQIEVDQYVRSPMEKCFELLRACSSLQVLSFPNALTGISWQNVEQGFLKIFLEDADPFIQRMRALKSQQKLIQLFKFDDISASRRWNTEERKQLREVLKAKLSREK